MTLSRIGMFPLRSWSWRRASLMVTGFVFSLGLRYVYRPLIRRGTPLRHARRHRGRRVVCRVDGLDGRRQRPRRSTLYRRSGSGRPCFGTRSRSSTAPSTTRSRCSRGACSTSAFATTSRCRPNASGRSARRRRRTRRSSRRCAIRSTRISCSTRSTPCRRSSPNGETTRRRACCRA